MSDVNVIPEPVEYRDVPSYILHYEEVQDSALKPTTNSERGNKGDA